MNRRLKTKVKKKPSIDKLKHHVIEQVKDVDDRPTLQKLSSTLEYQKRVRNSRKLRNQKERKS